ncbi:MAG: fructoselysine 6-kinase, partial [Clostridia bacterium]|nr:fructoselysine 6-kinase [Clostridia bacterium]
MKLAAVGSNCVDFYNNVEGGKAFPGGGPVNMAIYTVRLGGEASYIGPVGNDVFGALMRRAVAEKGVDVSHLSVREGKTAVTQVSLIDGERVFG